MTIQEKLISLQRHLERTKQQTAKSPAMQDWINLEIKRTEAKIAHLKLAL